MHLYTQLDRLYNALLKHKKDNEIYSMRNKYAVGAMSMDQNGNIISLAYNSYLKTHPYMKELAARTKRPQAHFLHAEVSAIIKARGNAHILLVTRLTANNKIALARPCPICSIAIKEANIDEVYYTDNSGNLVLFNIDKMEEYIV